MPRFAVFTAAATIDTISFQLSSSQLSIAARRSQREGPCPSMNPGMAICPWRSTTRSPAHVAYVALCRAPRPIAANRPPVPRPLASSTVPILPVVRTVRWPAWLGAAAARTRGPSDTRLSDRARRLCSCDSPCSLRGRACSRSAVLSPAAPAEAGLKRCSYACNRGRADPCATTTREKPIKVPPRSSPGRRPHAAAPQAAPARVDRLLPARWRTTSRCRRAHAPAGNG